MVNPLGEYGFTGEINANMDKNNLPYISLAIKQWQNYVNILRENGVNPLITKQGKNVGDQVYAANAGLVVEGKDGKKYFIPSHFRTTERQPEETLFIDYFRQQGYIIADVVKGYDWEGEGDMLFFNGHILAGFNNYEEAFKKSDWNVQIVKVINRWLMLWDWVIKLVLLELQHPQGMLYHLDTAIFPLDDESIAYHPNIFL